MVRKVSFVVRPTPAVGALLAFAQATRKRRSGLGERVEREVALGLVAAARSLEPVLGPLRWLSRRGLARASGFVDASGLAEETSVTFDLRAAIAAAVAPGARVDGRAYTDLYALRSLVRSVREAELVALDAIALGRQLDTARSLLRVVDEACRETALRDSALVPKAFARVTPPATESADAAGPAAASPSPRREARAPGGEATPPAGVAGATVGSFGDLPDDATSPPTAPEAVLSARGLTDDAEFFLESARLKAWPCSAKALTRARRSVLVALHPDRAGEGSEARFRSALKGFEELARSVSTTPSAPRPVAPPVRPASPPPPPVAAAGFGQWPPPPPPQSFKRSSKA